MQAEWIRREGSERLIAVFGGWAVGPAPFKALRSDCDLIFLSDYRELNWKPEVLRDYQQADVLAWSFGVAAYGHWQAANDAVFSKVTALNGTLSPIDRRAGIPPVVFRRTYDTLTEASYLNFLERVHGAAVPANRIDVTERKAELDAVAKRAAVSGTHFDRIWISEADQIFPPANQNRAWSDQNEKIRTIVAGPHAPFAQFSNIDEFFA